MEGAAPNLEKIYEQKVLKKLSFSMQALLGLYKPRDRQLVGLLNKAIIPPALVQAKNWYEFMIESAKSDRFREILKKIRAKMISPLVDMFTPYPVPIDTLLKDQATSQGELNVFGIPDMPRKGPYGDEEDETEQLPIDEGKIQSDKEKDIEKLEAEIRAAARESFAGPEAENSEKTPFFTLRDIEDNE